MSRRVGLVHVPVRRRNLEACEQHIVVEWMRLRKLLFTHIPMGGYRGARSGLMMKKLGASKGAPDIICFSPPPKYVGRVGYAFEMKAPGSYSKGTPEQKAWLAALAQRGWLVGIFAGAQPAIYALEQAGY